MARGSNCGCRFLRLWTRWKANAGERTKSGVDSARWAWRRRGWARCYKEVAQHVESVGE